MSRQITDEEIRQILIDRKRAEREAQDDAKWQNISEWCEAFMLVGFTFLGIVIAI